jgi:hypothetical protein
MNERRAGFRGRREHGNFELQFGTCKQGGIVDSSIKRRDETTVVGSISSLLKAVE